MKLTSRLLIPAGILLLAGCGGKTVPVEGNVTLDGEPLAGATVMFIPVKEGGQPATGLTDANGKFQLKTGNDKTGALPGEYKVVVSVAEEMKFSGGDHPDPAEVGKLMRAGARRKKTEIAKKSAVPVKYRSAGTTPFQETVPPKGKISLELKSR